MKPTNNHERTIAEAVDEKFLDDRGDRYHLIVRDIAMFLDFAMSASDTEFLIGYVRWRHTHPMSFQAHRCYS